MKIASVRTRVEHLDLARPYTIAFRTIEAVESVVVELETECGRVGLGTSSPEPFVTGETNEASQAALTGDAAEWIIGRDVRELPGICRELVDRLPETPAARAALDIALHDLFGLMLDKPLVEVLGRAHFSLPTSVTIGIKGVDETLTEAREHIEAGFRVLKVKLGRSLEEDLERLRAIRRDLGAEVTVRVDPNQGYDVGGVLGFVEQTRDLDVEFLEQPMDQNDWDGLRSLPENIRRQVAADEMLQSPADALRLVAPPAYCGIFNIKLMKCGGVFAARQIAEIAAISGTRLMWGCMDESVVSISAALHAALASPATRYLDLDGSFDLARDVATGGFELEDGCLRTTDAPGLGVRLL